MFVKREVPSGRAIRPLKVHGQVVQTLPLEQADIEVMIAALREITPPTQRVIRMIELLEQIRDRRVAG